MLPNILAVALTALFLILVENGALAAVSGFSVKGTSGPVHWNVSGLTEDTFAGPFAYSDIADFSTYIYFNNYFTNLTVGGFTAKNMSLGGSTKSYNWYPFFGDGALGLCNPALYEDVYPKYLDVEWFYDLGFTGDVDRFAIFLPKIGAGDVGELTIGGTNSARYRGSIQWVDAVRAYYGYENWFFNFTTVQLAFGSSSFTMLTSPGVKKTYVDMAYEGIWLDTTAYNDLLTYLKAVNDTTLNMYTVDCKLRHSGATPITLTFDSKTKLVIPADA
ncbi:hypothetical protein HDU76_006744, partial [Blyttiomyces sp. JEL0837]